MSKSTRIDSALGGRTMPNPYSAEMRERVIARVESGGSRREAAEHFEISASAAVKWLQRWRDAGSSTAMPRGGSTSDRKSTRLNSSHLVISYAVFCLKKKKK